MAPADARGGGARARARRRARATRLHLVRDAHGNEALVVDALLARASRTLFMVDTAYAGAPVLSTSLLAAADAAAGGADDVAARYRRTVARLQRGVGEAERHEAVHRLLASGRCRAYTSGCTMRLMGIGATAEARADMLLCPPLALDGRVPDAYVDADVLVTHPLPHTPHILTVDYLLHRAPCAILPRAGLLLTRLRGPAAAGEARGFHFFEADLVGGAFVVPMTVGDVALRIVVDTGAAAALSLAASAADRLLTCSRPAGSGLRATQLGVNGERVCSEVLRAPVRVGPLDLGVVSLLANTEEVQGADGYAGMGLLRALDLWLEPRRIGVRASGLAPEAPRAVARGRCERAPARPRCDAARA